MHTHTHSPRYNCIVSTTVINHSSLSVSCLLEILCYWPTNMLTVSIITFIPPFVCGFVSLQLCLSCFHFGVYTHIHNAVADNESNCQYNNVFLNTWSHDYSLWLVSSDSQVWKLFTLHSTVVAEQQENMVCKYNKSPRKHEMWNTVIKTIIVKCNQFAMIWFFFFPICLIILRFDQVEQIFYYCCCCSPYEIIFILKDYMFEFIQKCWNKCFVILQLSKKSINIADK